MNDEQNTPAVAKEAAEAEFERWAEAMDLDFDPTFMDSEDVAGFEKHKRLIIKSLMRGTVVVIDDGRLQLTPCRSRDRSPITFGEPSGATYMASDNAKKGKDVAKMNHMLADLTEQPADRFAKLKGRDVKICQAVLTLFLASE